MGDENLNSIKLHYGLNSEIFKKTIVNIQNHKVTPPDFIYRHITWIDGGSSSWK